MDTKGERFNVQHESVYDDKDAVSYSIPGKYRGTQFDRHDMSMLGKKQVLRRQFKFSTMLGFASTVMVAWEFVLLTSPFTLQDGGTPGVFWVRTMPAVLCVLAGSMLINGGPGTDHMSVRHDADVCKSR